jgi:hypothetical protein
MSVCDISDVCYTTEHFVDLLDILKKSDTFYVCPTLTRHDIPKKEQINLIYSCMTSQLVTHKKLDLNYATRFIIGHTYYIREDI